MPHWRTISLSVPYSDKRLAGYFKIDDILVSKWRSTKLFILLFCISCEGLTMDKNKHLLVLTQILKRGDEDVANYSVLIKTYLSWLTNVC